MKCRECQDDLPALLDDELQPSRQDQLREHLDRCASCAGVHSQLQAALQAVAEAPRLQASAGFDAAFTRKLQDAQRARRLAADPAPRARPWWRMPLFGASALSACAAAVMAVVLLGSPEDPPGPDDPGASSMAIYAELSTELDLAEVAGELPGVAEASGEDILEDGVVGLAADLEMLQQLEAVVDLESAEDFDVVVQLDTLIGEDS